MNLFLDTSALVKLYNEEIGTDVVSNLVNRCEVIYISELARLETISTFLRLHRGAVIDRNILNKLVSYFNLDLERYIIKPLNSEVIKNAEDLIIRFGDKIALRSLDAIHLATFYQGDVKDSLFVTADKRLEEGAQKLGAETINPNS